MPPVVQPPEVPPTAPVATITGATIRLAIQNGVPLAVPFPPNFAGGPSGVIAYQHQNMRRIYASSGSEIRMMGETYASGGWILSGMSGGSDALGRPALLNRGDVSFDLAGNRISVQSFTEYYLNLSGDFVLDQVAAQW